MESAMIFHDATPEEYRKLLISLIDFTTKRPPEERLIFINAWNEWAEGNYLEPDTKNGTKLLKATKDALSANY